MTADSTTEPIYPAHWIKVTAYPVKKRGLWYLTLLCPHCGEAHYHGGAGPEKLVYGPRVAHCAKGPGGSYVLMKS